MVLLTAFDDIVNNAFNLEIVKKPITLKQILELVERNMNCTIDTNVLSYLSNGNKVFDRAFKKVALEEFGLQI
ncbi:MAG TPA: hypothetical protein VFV86_00960 [Nitrososphaeraceae archaeon]|nr:hypothetical protein [Nitrososphaeraceae archaeon]